MKLYNFKVKIYNNNKLQIVKYQKFKEQHKFKKLYQKIFSSSIIKGIQKSIIVLKRMKNKKKNNIQKVQQNRNEFVAMIRKSPIKNKSSNIKYNSTVQSLQSKNSENNGFKNNIAKQSCLIYGKKYHYNESKKIIQSNQSSTHCSFSIKQKSFDNSKKNIKSKSLKGRTKQEQIKENNEQEEIRLNEKQIMNLINSYATKIQKQWRMYWFRKCLRFIILKQNEIKHYKMLNQFYGTGSCGNSFSQQRQYKQKNKQKNSVKINNNSRYYYELQSHACHNKYQQNENKRHTLPKLSNAQKYTQKDQFINKDKPKSNKSQQFQQFQQSINHKHIQNKRNNQKNQISNSQNQFSQQYFNNKKYGSICSLNSDNNIPNPINQLSSNIINSKRSQQHQRTSSLGQKIQQNQQQNQNINKSSNLNQNQSINKMVQIGLNCSLTIQNQNNNNFNPSYLNTPINQFNKLTQNTQKKSSDIKKNNNIKLQTKVYQCQLSQLNQLKKINNQHNSNSNPKLSSIKNFINNFNDKQKQSQNIKSQTSIKINYDTKFPQTKIHYDAKFPETKFPQPKVIQKDPFGMSKIFKKCKKAIQKQVNKKISKLSKNFQQKQITQRTYKHLVKETKDKLNNQIKILQIKQGNLKKGWNQVYTMFKDYVKQNSFRLQQDNQNATDRLNNSNLCQGQQHSISFDKWDFQSSAKKSISQLQSFQQFARQLNQRNPDKLKGFYLFDNKNKPNDNKTIQKVLDELDKLEGQINFQEAKLINQLNEQQQQGNSILQQFRQRQRTNSFQKKSQHILIQNITKKVQTIQLDNLKSPHVSPKNSPLKSNPTYFKQYKNGLISQQNQILQNQKFISPKKQTFQFPNIITPTKSFQTLKSSKTQLIDDHSPVEVRNTQTTVKTEQSEQGSQVQIKITSINVQNKQKQKFKQNQLFIPQNKNQIIKNSLKSQEQRKRQQYELEQRKIKQQKKQMSLTFVQYLATKIYLIKTVPKIQKVINQVTKLLKDFYKQKTKRKQLQQVQLRKYPPTIDPTIDATNTWLLQISHHLLDHHNADIKKNLLHIKQIPKQQMLQICHSQKQSNIFYHTHSYITISQKIFKQFQFFYIKNVAGNLEIQQKHQQNFQNLLYAFHRCLIDCMNLTLLDELSVGRNWVMIPWINSFRYRKNQVFQHTKQCLERAINKVSGWAEYNLAQISQNNQVNVMDWKQYQQQKMNLVIRQQVLQFSFDNQFVLSNLVLQICQNIYESQIILATKQISQTFNHKNHII